MEDIRCRLSDIDLLSFSQIVYLLKEMMIGYDALIDIFGTFDPQERMIAISANYSWKVWISDNFYKNAKPDTDGSIGVREFIYRLLLIA
jgi:hypothetical protein